MSKQNTAEGVTNFENVVKMSEFGQTIGYKDPDLPSTNCLCLFFSGRRIKQALTSAEKNWVRRLAVWLIFQII